MQKIARKNHTVKELAVERRHTRYVVYYFLW